MNNRIRELFKQAYGYSPSPIGEPEAKKFAELLIRECARVADVADKNNCEWIGGNILTHFGVKNQ